MISTYSNEVYACIRVTDCFGMQDVLLFFGFVESPEYLLLI